MKDQHNWLPKKEPWQPHDYDEATVYALRAFASGEANAYQQKLVWDYVMYLTAASPEFADLAFRPGADGQRATDFALGKNFIGLQLRKLLREELTPEADQPKDVMTRRMIAQRMRRQREKMEKSGG